MGVLAAFAQFSSFAQSASSAQPFSSDAPGGSRASTNLRVDGVNPGGWLFPITQLDRSLPPWLQFGGQFRNRAEGQLGLGYGPVNDGYDLTQLRLGVYIQPTHWLEFVGVTQDSRVFFNHHVPTAPSYQNMWDVREAYVRVGSEHEGLLDAVVGREILSFGDERVIGPSDWSNMGRTFDTARLNIHPSGAMISIFVASVIFARDGVVDHHFEGNNLYGVYTSFTHIVPHSTIEPYLLWRVAPPNLRVPENAGHGALSEVTGGIRAAGYVPGNLDYDVEMNWQTGSLGPYTIDAWAGHWNLGYAFKSSRMKPRPFVEYNYATGNKNPNGKTWSTHDQIYPSAHNKMDVADQFGWKNIKELRVGMLEKIASKWTFMEYINDVRLATRNDGVYGTGGAIAIAAHPGATSNHIGDELDLVAEHQQNKHVTYGFGIGHIFTGRFLNETTKGKDFNYPFAYATYVF